MIPLLAKGSRLITRSAWPALACAAAACASGITDPIGETSVSSLVIGEAARALDAQGHFILPRAVVAAEQPVIDEARAGALALAFVRTIGTDSTFLAILEMQHGGPVSPQDLAASSRVEFADSPYEPTPSSYGAPTRRAMGPYFLVRLLSGNSATATVAVSVYDTELEIRDGLVVFPPESGGEFQMYGSPLNSGSSDPISPERATQVVAAATGAKIAHVPELLRPDWRFAVGYSQWLITLDHAVSLRGVETGQTYQTTSVYVGQGRAADGRLTGEPAMFLPWGPQPNSQQLSPEITLNLRPDKPIQFEEVRM